MKIFYVPRKLRRGLIMTVTLLILGFAAALVNQGETLSVLSPAQKPLPIYCVDTEQKQVAITLDAAWGDDQTEGILDVLDRYQAKATFFLVGYWVDAYPDDVKAIAEHGHVIGNHSSTHPHMSELNESDIRKEITDTNDKITALTGKPVTLFRPPYGDYDDLLVTTVRDMDMEIIQWDVDSLDWKDLTADDILARVKKSVGPGSILLFHNNSTYILEALDATLSYLQSEGYEFVTVDELVLPSPYIIDHTGRQFPQTTD